MQGKLVPGGGVTFFMRVDQVFNVYNKKMGNKEWN